MEYRELNRTDSNNQMQKWIQLQEEPPPANRAVLMLYNTGALKEFETHNSILDINDVKPYIKPMMYPIPLSYAYPFFGWGVKFKYEEFVAIVSAQDSVHSPAEHIRIERATYSEIAAVKEFVEGNLGKPQGGNILYHLDNTQLKNYSSLKEAADTMVICDKKYLPQN